MGDVAVGEVSRVHGTSRGLISRVFMSGCQHQDS